jgi:hypothetical protein
VSQRCLNQTKKAAKRLFTKQLGRGDICWRGQVIVRIYGLGPIKNFNKSQENLKRPYKWMAKG